VMNGVLHHIEHPVPVVEQMARWLAPGGELRVMVYSDNGWRAATGTEPPADVTDHPARERFVRWGDELGDWADWYSEARLAERFGAWFDVERFRYIAGHGWYATALLRVRKP
jgi:SAM-dependent methyltransferase